MLGWRSCERARASRWNRPSNSRSSAWAVGQDLEGDAYDDLFAAVAEALDGVPAVDLTAELITHRFTPKSKAVLDRWYPGSKLEMDEAGRSRKLTKFGSVKYVFPKETMGEMRAGLEASLHARLPTAGVLYWT